MLALALIAALLSAQDPARPRPNPNADDAAKMAQVADLAARDAAAAAGEVADAFDRDAELDAYEAGNDAALLGRMAADRATEEILDAAMASYECQMLNSALARLNRAGLIASDRQQLAAGLVTIRAIRDGICDRASVASVAP